MSKSTELDVLLAVAYLGLFFDEYFRRPDHDEAEAGAEAYEKRIEHHRFHEGQNRLRTEDKFEKCAHILEAVRGQRVGKKSLNLTVGNYEDEKHTAGNACIFRHVHEKHSDAREQSAIAGLIANADECDCRNDDERQRGNCAT